MLWLHKEPLPECHCSDYMRGLIVLEKSVNLVVLHKSAQTPAMKRGQTITAYAPGALRSRLRCGPTEYWRCTTLFGNGVPM